MTSISRWVGSWALLLGLAVGCPGAAVAQQGQFGDTTSVVVVEVPVHVTRDGAPVRGLGAENFEVYDGRSRREITGFEVIDLSALASRRTGAVPASARRHFLLFFDFSFSRPDAIERARQAARDLVLAHLHATDLVAVGSYSSRGGFRMLLNFTSDRRQIDLALEALAMPGEVNRVPDPLRLAFDAFRDVNFGADDPDQRQRANNPYREVIEQAMAGEGSVEVRTENLGQYRRRVERSAQENDLLAWSRALSELAHLMRGIDGRKHVVYLSEGFDSSFLVGSADLEEVAETSLATTTGDYLSIDSDRRYGSSRFQRGVMEMLGEFRRADCSVQAVDIGGLRTLAGVDVGRGDEGQDGLFLMARETGGEFYRNFNNLGEAMGRMLEGTSVTYVLAFQPEGLAFDGSYHRLKVRLKDAPKGARISHRPGYFEPRPLGEGEQEEIRLLTGQKLVAGREGGELGVAALAVPFREPGGRAYVPVIVEVSGESLVRSAQGGRVTAEVYAYAFDGGGGIADYLYQPLTVDLAQAGERLRQGGLKYFGHLHLAPGEYAVRVLVREAGRGASGLAVAPLTVPDFGSGGAVVLPPLFPELEERWLLVREGPREGDEHAYPFVIKDRVYVPSVRPELSAPGSVPVAVVAYGLGEGEPELGVTVLGPDGQDVGLGRLDLVERTATGEAGLDRLFASFSAPGLGAGEYTVVAEVRDPESGRVHRSSLELAVGEGYGAGEWGEVSAVAEGRLTAEPEPELPALDAAGFRERYREILGRLAAGEGAGARSSLARLESEAVGEGSERAIQRLGKLELQVVRELVRDDPEVLIPVFMLHREMFEQYSRERQAYLAYHARGMVEEYAALYAKLGGTAGSRVVAARAVASLGGALVESGARGSARITFEKALGFDRENAYALLGLAAVHEKGGEYGAAVGYLERLVAAHPKHWEGRARLGVNLARQGKAERSEALFREVIGSPGADWVKVVASQELARLYAAGGRLEAAVEVLEAAVQSLPQQPQLAIQLAYLLERAREPQRSLRAAQGVMAERAPEGSARNRYNTWPEEAFIENRRALAATADSRLRLLASALAGAAKPASR